jgi:hypothetical protein
MKYIVNQRVVGLEGLQGCSDHYREMWSVVEPFNLAARQQRHIMRFGWFQVVPSFTVDTIPSREFMDCFGLSAASRRTYTEKGVWSMLQ